MDPISIALQVGGKLIDHFFPDSKDAEAAKLKLLELQMSGELAKLTAETDLMKGQMAINQTEASGDDKFARRWRPFVGWVCGIGLAYHTILQPFLAFIIAQFGYSVTLPTFDTDLLNVTLMGMLGLGTMRTVEKVKRGS